MSSKTNNNGFTKQDNSDNVNITIEGQNWDLLDQTLGPLQSLPTADKSSIVNSITEVKGKVDTNTANITSNSSQIGNLSVLIPQPTSAFSNYAYASYLAWLNDTETRQSEYGISVKGRKFGAVGNGVADDTTAIQNAINSLTNGGTVFIPAGTYNISELHFAHKVSMVGAGRDITTINHTGSTKAFYNNTSNNTALGELVVEDFTLNMNANTTVGIDFRFVYMSNINRVHITGGTNVNGIGVNFADGNISTAFYNTCYDVSIGSGATPLGTGFKFLNGANSNRLIACRTNGVTMSIDIQNCDQVVIFGGAFEVFTTGANLNGVSCSIMNSRFENGGASPNGTGINITATSTNNIIIGNTMENLTNTVVNNNTTGGQFIFNYSQMSVKFLQHETGGGWISDVDMRNNNFKNPASLWFQIRTSTVSTTKGVLSYADGTNWNPANAGEGLHIYDGTNFRKLKLLRTGTTANRPTTTHLGMEYFDTTLNKPIWYGNSGWVDSTGATV